MTDYLEFVFQDSAEFISTWDELPLWSAPFGLLLLKHVELKSNLTVIDLGSGAGFPLIELAERLGSSSKCFGLDTWIHANDRARQKIKNYEPKNVEIIDGSANQIPFGDASIDLIVSNLGINNFENPPEVFAECSRVLKHGGKLALTTNLNGHWKEFYDLFEETLLQINRKDFVQKLTEHQEHRGTVETISKLFSGSGLKVTGHYEEKFEMRFLDGSSFLRHHFVKLGWLSSWKDLLPKEELKTIFKKLEDNLNSYAKKANGLTLTVPMAFVEGTK
jgi:arsenite methyltransferase